jgi:undecaprenyl pyrophosphate phosphatase UppP
MALIPALGLSIAVIVVGGFLGLSEAAADRGSQIVLFPAFLGAYHYTKRRRSAPPA